MKVPFYKQSNTDRMNDYRIPLELRDKESFHYELYPVEQWERDLNRKHSTAAAKEAKQINAAIAGQKLAMLDALAGHPNRDAILDILESPLSELDSSLPVMYDDSGHREFNDLIPHEWKAPTTAISSTFELVADHMKFRVRHLACWRLSKIDSTAQYKRLVLDPKKFKRHVTLTTKAKQYHGIRELVFYPKTYKYLPLKGEEAARRASIDDSAVTALFAHFHSVHKS
jgi:hypothetical protein